jgi:hypothetical protein
MTGDQPILLSSRMREAQSGTHKRCAEADRSGSAKSRRRRRLWVAVFACGETGMTTLDVGRSSVGVGRRDMQ